MKTLYKIRRNADNYYLDEDGFSKEGCLFSYEEIKLGIKYYTLSTVSLTLIKYVGDKKYEYFIDKNILKILNRDDIIDEIINI